MLHNLTGWHALVILAIVVLVFGSTKLPALARSVGQSVRILKDEVHDEPGSADGQPTDLATAADRRAS
ncbi:Sec-independent protein translocase TatA [Rhodococcus triatomae]|uniref:Sec-independent protein translocase protein TatA n=1 Tax=Rhodococcus triatomae TaxID=300028 RepID=A0A1G8EZH4_9NOCA|nr:twin-arginine translocase TatA/TatE family subunit [Rhodococcus triatomae]QNG19334.1 Sec-independent protein translocase TatA [Rhodococcus triatomae]QNG24753.1 Sec-independent protein translocase TatA [Rhodococcus triatomae]SDH75149.1 sec-independent protein translocase protein TatA [Rhodococcus triatomae]